MSQIPLALRLDKHSLFATFVEDEAGAAAHVAAVASGERRDVIWLCGPEGTGKTHLLQAACHRAGEAGLRSMYLSLDATEGAHPDQLLGVDSLQLLALDAVDAVAARSDWEERLFSVLNHFLDGRGGLLLAARVAPSAAPFALPDLASRASAAVVYRLKPLDDQAQLAALTLHAHQRGLELDAVTARYLLNHVRRGMPELCGWLDRLDRASLAAQRRLTIPFIRAALAAQGRD